MRQFLMSAVILVGVFGLWLSAGIHREAPLVGHRALTEEVAAMEDEVALDPEDSEKLAALCRTYLERKAPGLALSAIQRASDTTRQQPKISYLWGRALLHEGHASDALVKQRAVLEVCEQQSCAPWLVASAARHEAFLEALVSRGVEDYRRDPEATIDAYRSIQGTTVAMFDPEGHPSF